MNEEQALKKVLTILDLKGSEHRTCGRLDEAEKIYQIYNIIEGIKKALSPSREFNSALPIDN